MIKKIDKKNVGLLLGYLIPVLITATYIVITLTIGGPGGTGADSSGIPLGSFFAIFIMPGIIATQKKRREQMKKKNNLGEM